MQKVFRMIVAVAMMLAFTPAMAQKGKSSGGFDSNKVFFGAGLSQNDVPGSDEGTGFQFFGGYEFGEVARNVKLDVEAGYMTTGDMDVNACVGSLCVRTSTEAKGLWATGVGRLMLNPQFELLGRLGLDFGDDDGLMFGIGGGFIIDKQSTLRLEFVERDNVSSLQINFVYRP